MFEYLKNRYKIMYTSHLEYLFLMHMYSSKNGVLHIHMEL